jgi:hypothetical protein
VLCFPCTFSQRRLERPGAFVKSGPFGFLELDVAADGGTIVRLARGPGHAGKPGRTEPGARSEASEKSGAFAFLGSRATIVAMEFDDIPTCELADRIRSGAMGNVDMSFAAEAIGERVDAPVDLLLSLLSHDDAVVREGAVYGLDDHHDRCGVAEALARLANGDPSPGVRWAAAEALE